MIKKQQGVALLIVLLLMLSLSVTALAVSETTRLSTARLIAGEQREQALWHLQSVELLALNTLQQQWQARPKVDTPDEAWLEKDIVIPLEEGAIVLRFVDRSTCFNVNGLVRTADHELVADRLAAKRFKVALRQRGVGRQQAERLVNVITDWIDSDQNGVSGGAEDSFYTRLEQPFRTGGRPLASVTSLRSMAGVSKGLYQQIKPILCALPITEQPKINVNMMGRRHIPVLLAAFDGLLSREEIGLLIDRRPEAGFSSIDAFFAQSLFQGKEIPPEVRQGFGVWSEYLTLTSEIRYGSAYVQVRSLVRMGEDGNPYIINREFGPSL